MEGRETGDLSTVFPPSPGHMAFVPRNVNLVSCLFSLASSLVSLSSLPLPFHAHLPHISVSVPGCWRITDGLGSCKDVNVREGCLFSVLSLLRRNTSCDSYCFASAIIAHWSSFSSTLETFPFCHTWLSAFIFISLLNAVCAHFQTVYF